MVNKNNPIGRLLSIIEKVESLKAEQKPNVSITKKAAWLQILELEDDSEIELIRAMLEVCDLARKSRVLISSFAPNPELYLANFENVELVVLPNELDKQFESTCRQISIDTVTRLSFACDMLSQYYNEGEVEKEELNSISKLVTELYQEVKASNTELSVKTFLLESLEGIRRSIFHYEIYGAKGLRDAFQSAIGGVVANRQELETTDKTLLDKFGTLLTVLDKTTATAFKAKEVLGKTLSLLGINS